MAALLTITATAQRCTCHRSTLHLPPHHTTLATAAHYTCHCTTPATVPGRGYRAVPPLLLLRRYLNPSEVAGPREPSNLHGAQYVML